MAVRIAQQRVSSVTSRDAAAAPSYEEVPPPHDLREIVACMWVRRVTEPRSVGASPIIPDGCGDLMAFDDDPPIVAGPDATTRWVTLGNHALITAVRLRPGAIRAVFGCPATTILNRAVRLSDLAADAGLHDRLRLAATIRQRLDALADWIRTALQETGSADRVVRAACRVLTAAPHVDVGDVSRALGWNTRAIRRHFHAACGYGPKHFQRIMRIQRAIREAQRPAARGLAEIAAAAGFADQAHLTREFRDITGFTPARYLATSRPQYGIWLTESWSGPAVRNVQDAGLAPG